MNPLLEYFKKNRGRRIHKWMHYFDIYHRHLERFRGQRVTVVEFGVAHGGSLQMWKHYFGNKATIIGVDIKPECKKFEEDQVSVHIGDQEDRAFLAQLRKKVGRPDVLIDDGGHRMNQQIATFEEMFPAVDKNGVYLVEDMHTSYWSEFEGGHQRPGTFVEYTKNLIDALNAWHSQEESLAVSDYTKTARSMHYYDSVLVIEKGRVTKPKHEKTGNKSL